MVKPARIKKIRGCRQNRYSGKAEPLGRGALRCAGGLSTVAVVASAFHFWPFEENRLWWMFCPSNTAVLAGMVLLAAMYLIKAKRKVVISLLPHVSILAYLAVNILSAGFAGGFGRTVSFTAKLVLMLLGGYMLFSSAISSRRALQGFYGLAAAAVTICVVSALILRSAARTGGGGFFGSEYKYGTYVGTLTALCGAGLFADRRPLVVFFAVCLLIGVMTSAASLGCIAAVIATVIIWLVYLPVLSTRLAIIGAVLCGLGVGLLTSVGSEEVGLKNEIRLAEKDGTNLKQRYIEWQAEVNLLEKRTMTGSGAGCINDHRSSFYYRLPKLNTLAAFDQNGWLATAAESGVLGLVCFCWIVLEYGKSSLRQLADSAGPDVPPKELAVGNLAALTAGCVANVFSSVQYNGVLIAFVLVLVLISSRERLCRIGC